MGVWGSGIFDDDLALDVRETFEDAIAGGASVDEAAQRVQEEYEASLHDVDDGPVVWLALAALQVEQDSLQPEVRRHALQVIDQEQGLDRWAESGEGMLTERKQLLEALKRRLQEAPPSQSN